MATGAGRWHRGKGLNFASQGLESRHRPSGRGRRLVESEEGLEPPSAGPRPAVLADWTIPTSWLLGSGASRSDRECCRGCRAGVPTSWLLRSGASRSDREYFRGFRAGVPTRWLLRSGASRSDREYFRGCRAGVPTSNRVDDRNRTDESHLGHQGHNLTRQTNSRLKHQVGSTEPRAGIEPATCRVETCRSSN